MYNIHKVYNQHKVHNQDNKDNAEQPNPLLQWVCANAQTHCSRDMLAMLQVHKQDNTEQPYPQQEICTQC